MERPYEERMRSIVHDGLCISQSADVAAYQCAAMRLVLIECEQHRDELPIAVRCAFDSLRAIEHTNRVRERVT